LARRPATLPTLIAWLDPLYLLAITPLLLFPTARPAITAGALAGLAVLGLTRWLARREPWPVTPFNGALCLFVIAIAVAVWASALPALTLPKLTGLILGLAAFRTTALAVRDRRTLGWALAVFALLGLAIWGVGVLGVGWSSKVAVLRPLTQRLPRVLTELPGAGASGINANQLAGGLMLYLPLAAACLVAWVRARRWGIALLALAGLGLAGATLVLSQSRGGWIGGGVGLAALLTLAGLTSQRLRLRRLAWLVPLILVVGTLAVALAVGPHRTGEAIFGVSETDVEDVVGQITLSGRVEIWSRALYAIQDFPFTGTGLGTFRRVVNLLYPLFTISPDIDIAHAHNMFLQVAVDLGLPGLIAYLALLWLAGVSAWRVARLADPLARPAALGLLAGLIALHTYGLADALAPGSKPAVAFWMALGLLAGALNLIEAPHQDGRSGAV
jgi:putative inorganic carbon (HCO3(-)) transporter